MIYLIDQDNKKLVTSAFGIVIESRGVIETDEILKSDIKILGTYSHCCDNPIRDFSDYNGHDKRELRVHLGTTLPNKDKSRYIVSWFHL